MSVRKRLTGRVARSSRGLCRCQQPVHFPPTTDRLLKDLKSVQELAQAVVE